MTTFRLSEHYDMQEVSFEKSETMQSVLPSFDSCTSPHFLDIYDMLKHCEMYLHEK